MVRMQRMLLGAALVAALAVGGALAPGLFRANAASGTTTNGTTTTTPAAVGTIKSNEDATHEAGESAARETAENNGTAGFGHAGGSNETAAHESGESAAREAAETAG